MINDKWIHQVARTYVRNIVLKEATELESMADAVHQAWMSRNPKADWNAAQHVAYEDLPEAEKAKDRAHVTQMIQLMGTHPQQADEPHPQYLDRLANMFGAAAHEEWRRGHEAKNGEGAPRMKNVSDGTTVNINVPWEQLHPEWKQENYAAGLAAARIVHGMPWNPNT